ncbi:MAG: HEAT repeat domain-containing protein [Pirellulaceae bacterium]
MCNRHFYLFQAVILGMLCVGTTLGFAQQEPPASGDEAALLSVLQSDAAIFDKAKACQQLAVTGSKDAVPVLAKLLADRQLSHYARYALEPLPDPSVDEALRASLTELQGELLVGVINTIGMRCDAGATETLTQMLSNSDVTVASAAAWALGRIATEPAVEVLLASLTAPEPLRQAVADGCLTAADTLEKENKAELATPIYDAMRQAELPKFLQIAALAGAIRSRGPQGVDLLVEQLKSEDEEFFEVGLSMAHLISGERITETLMAELAQSPDAPADETKTLAITKAEYGAQNTWIDVTEQLVGAMQDDGISIRAGNELAGTDPVPGVVKSLRVAYTLGGQPQSVTVPEGGQLQLEGSFPRNPRQASVVAVLGERGDRAALPIILKLAQEGPADVRLGAIRALAKLGDVSAVPPLFEIAVSGQGAPTVAAIASLADLPDPKADAELLAMLEKSDGTRRLVLIDLVGRREIPAAVPALMELAGSTDRATSDAAFASLGLIVRQEDLAALVNHLVKPASPEAANAAKAALRKACQRMPDRDAAAQILMRQMSGAPQSVQADLLDLLGDLGGAQALEHVVAAAKGDDEPLQDAATRVLGRWMNPDAAPRLLELTKAENNKFKVRTLRGYIRIARQLNVPTEQRIEMCQTALALADRDEDRSLVLETLGRYPAITSLKAVTAYLDNPALREVASSSAVAIGEKLADQQPREVAEAMKQVVAATTNDDLLQKAKRLLSSIEGK